MATDSKGNEIPRVPLEHEGENWMQLARKRKLRERGWEGTVSEYMQTKRALGGKDPLKQVPPITRPRAR